MTVFIWLIFGGLDDDAYAITNVQSLRLLGPNTLGVTCFGNDEVIHRKVERFDTSFTFTEA